MDNRTLVRLAASFMEHLGETLPGTDCALLIPTYNALLNAAQAQNPEEPFLSHLQPLQAEGHVDPEVLRVLMGQLQIVLESLSPPAPPPPAPSPPPPLAPASPTLPSPAGPVAER